MSLSLTIKPRDEGFRILQTFGKHGAIVGGQIHLLLGGYSA
jgi:hypothetical protein